MAMLYGKGMVTVIDILIVSVKQGQCIHLGLPGQCTHLGLPEHAGQPRDLPGDRDVSFHSHSKDGPITSVPPGPGTGAGLDRGGHGALLTLIAVVIMLMGTDIMASVRILVLGGGTPRHPGSGSGEEQRKMVKKI